MTGCAAEYQNTFCGTLPKSKGGAAAANAPKGHHQMQNILPMSGGQGKLAFIREGSCRFTPAQAAFVLRECAYAKNRDWTKAQKHVDVLMETMRRGLWIPRDQIAFALTDGQLTLINGHHRMAAQAASGVDIEWSIAIHPCRDAAEVAALYARYDTNIRKRTDENVLSALGLADACGISPTTARALWRAAPILANNLYVGRKHDDYLTRYIADDRLALAKSYAAEAREFERALTGMSGKAKIKITNSGAITSVALVTMRANLASAFQFWRGIAENDGLRKGDPRSTFRDWLIDNNAKAAGAGSSVFAAAKAWNYYVDGKTLSIIKVSGNPIRIAGTSYVVAP